MFDKTERERFLRNFVDEAKKREIQGLAVYGDFDPKTDTRILSVEAQEEAIDVLNYCRFLLRKHPSLREKIDGVKRLSFCIYRELRKLEAEEMRLNQSRREAHSESYRV